MPKESPFAGATLELQLSSAHWCNQSQVDLIQKNKESVTERRRKPWYLDVGCGGGQSWKRIIWRALNGVLAVLFACATVLQWNDPDTHVWTVVYVVPCLLSLSVAVWNRIQDYFVWIFTAILHIVGCLAGVIYISVRHGDKISNAAPNITSIEEGWELCGLLVVIFWLIIAAVVASYRSCQSYIMTSLSQSRKSSRVVFNRSSKFEPERLE